MYFDLFWMCRSIFVVHSIVLKDKRTVFYYVIWDRFFEKVIFNLRLSLEPFKDLDGRFDPSSTALTKRSQTLSNDTCVSRILSSVFETDSDSEIVTKSNILICTRCFYCFQVYCLSATNNSIDMFLKALF